MEVHEAFELATSIVVRHREIGHFINEQGEQAYYDALILHDFDVAAPIVRQMLAQNPKPWPSSELARVIYNAAHAPEVAEKAPPPDPEEQRRRIREGLAGCKDLSWMPPHMREKLGLTAGSERR